MTSNTKFSDKELIKLLQQNNKEAFLYLYNKYSAPLYGSICKTVKNEKLAAKILEIGFIKIWESCSSISCIKTSLFAWMYGIINKQINTASKTEETVNRTFEDRAA